MAESDYQTISVRKDFIPEGDKLVEAYESETEVVVFGTPEIAPEGLSETEYDAWEEVAHNCDAMGCPTLGHIMYRFVKPAEGR